MRENRSDRRTGLLDRLRALVARRPKISAGKAFTARESPPNVGKPPPKVTAKPSPRPDVHIHEDRLAAPAPRVELTPSQALHLASGKSVGRRPRGGDAPGAPDPAPAQPPKDDAD